MIIFSFLTYHVIPHPGIVQKSAVCFCNKTYLMITFEYDHSNLIINLNLSMESSFYKLSTEALNNFVSFKIK
ncbi:hypothetical protein BpHYR1_016338 [Brachionus plicatilis]|uniref:Uncharacterized protein n=1 Tax=Brachionus plicatilis TaxID=10195 RepID=A0A3M7QXS4_BRAPC|nr:hypothetical protein BpHYR1_016338 [Brachionus plicatilis]